MANASLPSWATKQIYPIISILVLYISASAILSSTINILAQDPNSTASSDCLLAARTLGVSASPNFWVGDEPYACTKVAISIFFILSIAAMTGCDLAGSGSASIWPRMGGMICQDTP